MEKKRPRGQRVLSRRSGTRAGGRVQVTSTQVASKQVASNMTPFEKWFENRTGSNAAMIPLSINPPPTRRDCPRRGTLSWVFQIRSATPETQFVQSLRRFAQPACPNPFTAFALGGCRWSGAYLSCSNRTARKRPVWEISTQNRNAHIAMNVEPTIAWKASPTRTPPPICTSAPFPKPRWSEEPWAPRTI